MKVLVTGGAGFIGSHLMRYLKAAGDEAVALDNLSTGRRENLEEDMTLIEMDVLDGTLAGVVATGQYDAIVHLAGQTLVSYSIDAPLFDAESNILGMLRVLEAARQGNVKRVIFSSTAAAYGNVPERDLPVKESHKREPLSFYGLSKVTAERYMELYQSVFGLDYVVLRFANVYGERQGDGGEGGVISIFSRQVASGNEITIYGDGEQTRDFVYAGDIAAGIAAALRTGQPNHAYNLSTQTQTSLRELVSLLSKIAERPITPKYGPERPGDIYKSALSNTRARRGLGWKSLVPLEEGLRRTYAYFLKKAE
ncbi:MAG: NAD-dependent epimerase/dehydratase family protein [Schwartzia sp.]|nr:NAD-dependent epimerase/dehydratase family protein [Schwartzia sp. (in: firmicutes)]